VVDLGNFVRNLGPKLKPVNWGIYLLQFCYTARVGLGVCSGSNWVVLSSSRRSLSRGFSLLEMVVAVAILGISLGALYQSVAGSTRIVRIDEKYAYAVELARSLLANNALVPLEGLNDSGETEGGFAWTVRAVPVALRENVVLKEGLLQDITVSVGWSDGVKSRRVTLASVVAGKEPLL
jgi:general secretion pathway protein I